MDENVIQLHQDDAVLSRTVQMKGICTFLAHVLKNGRSEYISPYLLYSTAIQYVLKQMLADPTLTDKDRAWLRHEVSDVLSQE